MFGFLLGLVIGVLLGWFFLPTPQWAKDGLTKVLSLVPGLSSFVKKD